MSFYAKEIETASREAIYAYQFKRLRDLLEFTYRNNAFYRTSFQRAGLSLEQLLGAANAPEAYRRIPLTAKQDLLDDQETHPPYGTNLALSPELFIRQHQTSGTTGRPLKVWETRESWDWLTVHWMYQFHALDVSPRDTIFMAFNFGHSLGMWNVLDAGMRIGALTLTGGGLNSLQRVESIVRNRATVLLCAPSYALRLAEVAAESKFNIRDSAVRMIISAGEPGASIPGTRDRIERLWGATLYDSPGATEVGHIGCVCPVRGVHVLESEFYVEVMNSETLEHVQPGEAGELVITNFGRPATPVIRYRTRDVARPVYDICDCGRTMMRLDGGIIGRSDDMFVVRGVNVFPSAIEAIIRECGEVSEYAVEVFREQEMVALKIKLELDASCVWDPQTIVHRLKESFHRNLYLKVYVEVLPQNSLPRFDGKSKRIIRRDV